MGRLDLSGVLFKSANFHLFSTLHLITLAIILSLFILIFKIIPYLSQKSIKYFEMGIVVISLLTTTYICYLYHRLPLQLCNVSSIILVPGVLLFRKKICSDLLICYTSWGALIAIFTPGLNAQATWLTYVNYFFEHGNIVFTAIYALTILRVDIDKKSLFNTIIYGNLYLIPISIYNILEKTNYLYLFHKPPFSTLYNALLPWPWYILQEELLGITLAFFTYIAIKYLRQHFSLKKELVTH